MASAAKRVISTYKTAETEKIISFSPRALKAPFLLRCAALFIDYMVLITLPVGWLASSSLFGETGVAIGMTVWFLAFLLVLVNFMALPLFRGQSIGKMVVGLTILKTDGTNIDLAILLRRNVLGYLITVLTLGLGFLISAVNPSGRTLHDYIAGTIVVRGRKTQV